jgi:hypothetical protein
MLVFIDESGDPGFKLGKGSTATFVAALAAFRNREEARLTEIAIEAIATRLGIKPEFRFSKCRPKVRDAFFETVRPFDFRVRAIVVQKKLIYSPHLRSEKEAFYAFFVKSMLKFDDGLLKSASVTIDGSGDRISKPNWMPISVAILALERSKKSGSATQSPTIFSNWQTCVPGR